MALKKIGYMQDTEIKEDMDSEVEVKFHTKQFVLMWLDFYYFYQPKRRALIMTKEVTEVSTLHLKTLTNLSTRLLLI